MAEVTQDTPKEPLEGFYNSLKANKSVHGLPENYNDFKEALSDPHNAQAFHQALLHNKTIKGIPSDYNEFSDGLGLKKKAATPASPNGANVSPNGSQPFQNIPANNHHQDSPAVDPSLNPFAHAPSFNDLATHASNQLIAKDEQDKQTRGLLQDPNFAKRLKGQIPQIPSENEAKKQDQTAYLNMIEPQKELEAKNAYKGEIKLSDRVAAASNSVYDGLGKIGKGAVRTAGLLMKKISPDGDAQNWENSVNKVNDLIDKGVDWVKDYHGLDKKEEEEINKGGVNGMVNGLANFAPALMLASRTGGISLYMNDYEGAYENIDKLDKEHSLDLTDGQKQLYSSIYGVSSAVLMTHNIHSLLGNASEKVSHRLVEKLSLDAMGDLAKSGEDLTGDNLKKALEVQLNGFEHNIKKYGTKVALSSAISAGDMGGLEGIKIYTDKLLNTVTGKKVFDTDNQAERMQGALSNGAAFGAVVGGLAKGTMLLSKGTTERNSVIESLYHDPSSENADRIKNEVTNHLYHNGMSEEDINHAHKVIDEIHAVAKTLPKELDYEKKIKITDLILERKKLEAEKGKIAEANKNTDQAFEEEGKNHEGVYQDRVDGINDKIKSLYSGKPLKFFKQDDVYYKQFGGEKPEKISESRYILEKPHTILKQEQSNNPQTQNNEESSQKSRQETGSEESIGQEEAQLPAEEKVNEPTIKGEGASEAVSDAGQQKQTADNPEKADEAPQHPDQVKAEEPPSKEETKLVNELDKISDEKGFSDKKIELETQINNANILKYSKEGFDNAEYAKSQADKFNELMSERALKDANGRKIKLPKIKSIELGKPNFQNNDGTVGVWKVEFENGSVFTMNERRSLGNPYSAMMQAWLNNYHEINKSANYRDSVFGRDNIRPSEIANFNPFSNKQVSNDVKEQPKLEVNKIKEPVAENKPVQEPKVSDNAKSLAEKIRALKSDKTKVYGGLQGIGTAVWDGGLETAATIIEQGGKLADAIQAAIEHIKANSTEKDDVKIKAALTKDLKEAGIEDEESTPQEEDGKAIGVSKERTKQQREERGAEALPEPAPKKLSEIAEEGKQAVEDGTINPRQLASEYYDSASDRPLSHLEISALNHDRVTLMNELNKIHKLLAQADAEKDPFTIKTLKDREAYLEKQLHQNDHTVNIGARGASLALNAMRNSLNEDYSYAAQKIRMAGKALGKLTPEMEKELDKLTKERDEALEALDRHMKDIRDDKAKEEIKKAELEARKAKKAQTKDALKAERKQIFEEAREALKKIRKSGQLSSDIPYRKEMAVLAPFVKKALVNLAKEGIVELKDVVQHLHDELKDVWEDITKEDVVDLISGKHDEENQPKPTQLQVEKEQRAVKKAQSLSKKIKELQDLEKKKKDDSKVVKIRKKIAELEEEARQNEKDINIHDDEEMKRQRYIKSLHKRIGELDDQIANGEKKVVKREDKYAHDAEVENLRKEREQKAEELDKIDPRQKEAADLARAIKGVEKSIGEYEERIAKKDLHPEKQTKEYKSEELDKLKEKRDKLKQEYEQLRKDEFTPEERKQQALQRRLDMLNERIKNKDFSKAEKKVVDAPTAKTLHLQGKVRRAENNFDAMAERLDHYTKTDFEKGLNKWRKIRLAFVLSGTKVLGKLYGFGAAKRVTNVMDEVANTMNAHIPGLSKIIGRSPRYAGGINFKAEAKAIAARWNNATLDDVWNTAKTGSGDLEQLYGKAGVDKEFQHNGGLLDMMQHIHGALKTATKRAEFFRSFEHRITYYANMGEDINDPDVQYKAGLEAFLDAKRAILMNDNYLTDKFYKQGLRALEQDKTKTGLAMAAFFRNTFPITKVPTNFVLNAYDRLTGAVPGLSRATPLLFKAIANGAESLTNKEADSVARILAKGQVGLAMVMVAWYSKGVLGGYYTGKRDKGDLKPGDLILFGVHIPHNLAHNDVIEAMQFAVTVKRAMENTEMKDGETPFRGGMLGLGGAAKGLFKEVPFFNQEYAKDLTSPDAVSKAGGDYIKNIFEPRIMQEVAEYADNKDKSIDFIQHPIDYIMAETQKRDPQGFVEQLKSGIPGLREEVAKKIAPEDKPLAKVKAPNGNGYVLDADQVEERRKLMDAYIKQHNEHLVKMYTKKVIHKMKDDLDDLAKAWQENGVSKEKQAEYKKKLIELALAKEIQKDAIKHTNIPMLKKYKKDGKITLKGADE